MTACKDSQATSGKKAVSATLAGVLAVGLVPAVALADEAVEVTEEDGITELDTATDAVQYNGGKVSKVCIGATAAVDTPARIEIPKASIATSAVVPAEIASNIEGLSNLTVAKDGTPVSPYKVYYFTKDAYAGVTAGSPWTNYEAAALAGGWGTSATDADSVWKKFAGGTTDFVAVTVNSAASASVTIASAPVAFSIIGGKTLQGAQFYEGADPTEATSTFTYSGVAPVPQFSLNGIALSSTDYDRTAIKYYKGASTTTASGLLSAAPTNAGDYIAVLTGKGDYLGSMVEVPFTIAPLDLSKASIELKDVEKGTSGIAPANVIASVNNVAWSAIDGNLQNALTVGLGGATGQTTGAYTATITANPADNKNVTGSFSGTFAVVDNATITAKIDINGKTVTMGSSTATVNLADKEAPADLSSIEVDPDVAYTVWVTDADGATVPNSSVTEPGTWTIHVKVDAAASDYAQGGSATQTVTVYKGSITQASDIRVSYKGKVAASFSNFYTGENQLDGVEVSVVDDKGNAVAPSDYVVTYANSTTNAKVTEFTNAGNYTVTVAPKNYNTTSLNAGNVCPFVIRQVTVSGTANNGSNGNAAASVTGTVGTDQPNWDTTTGKIYAVAPDKGTSYQQVLSYTGSAIVPALQYQAINEDGSLKKTADGKQVYASLPASAYTIDYAYNDGTDADYGATPDGKNQMLAAGYWKLNLSQAAVQNFAIDPGANVAVQVADTQVFDDVTTSDWFYKPVLEANEAGYMKGYNGTKLFGPNADIKRGDVACVLYNMAGGAKLDEGLETDDQGYPTPFSDVDKGMYWAKAIQWAAKAGVVHGYAGTDTFRPDANITREEFAAMLANYAKQRPGYEAPSVDAELASFPDGSAVSGWARESVAWATSADVMGNGGFLAPLSNITRAETAAMAVNYQPYEG